MNKVVNKLLLAGDNFMPELHLRHPRFTYSTCKLFIKHREKIQIFRETGNLKHIYKNELDKACFAHDKAYFDSKHLAKRTISGKILKDTAYGNAIDPKYDGYQRGLVSMVNKFFNKKTGSKSGASVNEELAQELEKQLIKNFKTKKVYLRFKDNIVAADLVKMGSLSSYN